MFGSCNYARGHCAAVRSWSWCFKTRWHSRTAGTLLTWRMNVFWDCTLSLNQCETVKPRRGLRAAPEFLGNRRGGDGVVGLKKWVPWRPGVEGAQFGWLYRTEEKFRAFCVCTRSLRSHCLAVVTGMFAWVYVHMLWGVWETAPDRCFVR